MKIARQVPNLSRWQTPLLQPEFSHHLVCSTSECALSISAACALLLTVNLARKAGWPDGASMGALVSMG